MKNPTWSRDELILALDAYFKIAPKAQNKSNPEIQELSKFLNQMASAERQKLDKYRNSAGVAMKLRNFGNIDPDYAGVGLSSFSKGAEEVWQEFSGDRTRLSKIADIIRETYQSDDTLSQIDYPEITEAKEGRTLTRIHIIRERDHRLVATKKKQTLAKYGFLACGVCDFDFKKVYGKRGEGFIECHHIRPLHTLEKGETTKLSDLALLCANCHRMIHTPRPWLSIDELKEICLSKGMI